MDETVKRKTVDAARRTETIDWYAEGQSRTVMIGDDEVRIRFVGRKGRRGRIVISVPAGARIVEGG